MVATATSVGTLLGSALGEDSLSCLSHLGIMPGANKLLRNSTDRLTRRAAAGGGVGAGECMVIRNERKETGEELEMEGETWSGRV